MSVKRVEKKFPIVYSKNYDITFCGLEKVHVFDSGKWGKIIKYLIEKWQTYANKPNDVVLLSNRDFFEPPEANIEDLELGHSRSYLDSLKSSYNVAKIVEVPFVAMIPNYFVNKNLLKRFRYHVGGTILATELAMEHQWGINVGGGFHHASHDNGGGFCVYADISIAIKKLQKKYSGFKCLIIDLDAHQGNGHERDFKKDDNVFIFDMYNEGIYPHDESAKRGINVNVGLMSYTKDSDYIDTLNRNLSQCFDKFEPNLIFYNAGTDCLDGDPLGRLSLSDNGIIERDEIVFKKANEKKCPIVMVTSGGYQMSNASIIANSIWNLITKEIIKPIDSINQTNISKDKAIGSHTVNTVDQHNIPIQNNQSAYPQNDQPIKVNQSDKDPIKSKSP